MGWLEFNFCLKLKGTMTRDIKVNRKSQNSLWYLLVKIQNVFTALGVCCTLVLFLEMTTRLIPTSCCYLNIFFDQKNKERERNDEIKWGGPDFAISARSVRLVCSTWNLNGVKSVK